jgi:hypothetical protein
VIVTCAKELAVHGDWTQTIVGNSEMFEVLRALDISILQFARWQQIDDDPEWLISGPKVFRSKSEKTVLSMSRDAKSSHLTALKGN